MSAAKHTPGLTRGQVFAIADKYGEFQYGDAQGHKRIEFAADVIAAHQRIRDAAPELLEALIAMRDTLNRNGYATGAADAVIAKATGGAL